MMKKMKRRQMLRILGLAPAAVLVSCKDKLPSTPTIIRGKIINENGDPLEGAGLRLSGLKWKGFTPVPTFVSLITESDKNGMYEFLQVVPNGTSEISILSTNTSKIIVNNQNYAVYIQEEGVYQPETSPYEIPRSSWSKTTTLNYQFIKQ